jgi:hypothetical protein
VGDTLGGPGTDTDFDGLSGLEEALTGTDPSNPDTDTDGLIDGLDVSWLAQFIVETPNNAFKRKWLGKIRVRIQLYAAELAVRFGDRSKALSIIDDLAKRADGCGSGPDRNDWIRDCDVQAEFNVLRGIYRRNVAEMDLPDPPRWWE